MTTTTLQTLLTSPSPSGVDHSLSVLWLFLCTSLVTQKPQFRHVFYAFSTCWILAGVAWVVQTKKTGSVKENTTTCSHPLAASAIIQHGIAMVALSASLLCHFLTNGTELPSQHGGVSILAGYLAFDHWYSALCRLPKPLGSIVKDAVALTLSVIVLATTATVAERPVVSLQQYLDYHGVLRLLYLSYELMQHAVQWQGSLAAGIGISHEPVVHEPDTDSLGKSKQPISEASSLVTTQATSIIGTNSDDKDKDAWIIHGVAYHLQDYVDRHPGGREAILLGQSRDCTALFESYHPFTTAHLQVLQKYRVKQETPPFEEPPKQRDAFYEVLCQRVADTLRAKGLDPIQDRTATLQRRLYYMLVIVCVLVAGYAHCKVCFCWY